CGGGQTGGTTGEPPAEGEAGEEGGEAPAEGEAGGEEETVITGGEAEEGAAEVLFWTSHSEPDLSGLKQIVDTFNEENAEIHVRLVQVPGSETEVTKLMTAVRGGTGPDVYMLDRFIVAQRAADGLLQELSQYAGGEDPLANHIDFAVAEATFAGKPYAVPFDTDARALFYNKTMLEEAGIDPAELDPANGPITWERLAEMAAQINQKEGDNYTVMGFVPWFDQGWHYTYGFSWGGDFYDEEGCAVTPDDAEIVEAFQWAYDYSSAVGPQQAQAFIQPFTRPDNPPQQHPFVTGRIAFDVTGDWQIASMEKYAPDVDYGITYLPVPNEGDESTTWAGGWSMVIPVGAKQPEAAYQFIQYIAGEPGQRIYTEVSSHLPTIKSLIEDPSMLDERHQFFAELLSQAKNRPPLPVGALYWDELTDAWEQTYLNETEPQAALTRARERVQPQLEPFCDQLQQ
ncbi:MAG: ABC transporter substrate-binding protein, partial [Ardenticatenaceae bacterium]